jgi:aspartate/methionine/tyrosine aminotransferase
MPQHKSLLSHSHRGDIAPFYAMEMMRHAFAMKAAGRDVLSLCVGQPAVGAPQAVRDEAARLLRDDVIGYTEALGLPALRERIAHHYKETYGVSIPAERVVITTGSSGGFLLAFLACFDAGARLALARPGYPPYFSIQKALNIEPLPVDVDETTAFQLTADHVRALCAMPGGVQGVMVASPANPTGSMLDAESFKSLAEACQAQGVRLISDEIYHGITFGKKAHSAGIQRRGHRHQQLFQILLHDRLAAGLDGGARKSAGAHRSFGAKFLYFAAHLVAGGSGEGLRLHRRIGRHRRRLRP